MYRQQSIGAVALGSFAQRRRIVAFDLLGIGDQLLLQVGQRQAQRQTTVLGGAAQGLGTGLAITDQVAALDRVVQPPPQYRGPVTAPQRQASLAQSPLGATWVELDHY
ncbi:hypothetical protein D3C80_1359640 [compost metagenome]